MWPCQISTNWKQHYWARPQCSSPLKIWRNFNAASPRFRFQEKLYVDERANCVKKAPTLATRSFNKHGLFFCIIFGKQHQHSFKNDMHIQPSLSLHFYLGLLYLLLNSCDGNDAKQRVFLSTVVSRLFVALKRATCSCVVCWLWNTDFSLADVRSGVLLRTCLHVTSFSI